MHQNTYFWHVKHPSRHHSDTQGARRFAADVRALIAVFQPYTLRPAAHFREASEAAALLGDDEARASALAHTLAGDPEGAGPLLNHMGVLRLTPQQAACVLARRLD